MTLCQGHCVCNSRPTFSDALNDCASGILAVNRDHSHGFVEQTHKSAVDFDSPIGGKI
ncbi:hypothetical protein CBM2609_B30004 [Cupriavidus taiwanensis]|nr:hypothetical protein CBM2604_B40004 [Cupriavidus taiwanensis]SOZ32312.1 hypothetical protein CBM2609_B30004 [Cupriavidus taiwanensis]SOZ47905.1 hypothetical protein CBM2610_B30004 [Cupriavidus taiwanensis]